jgi:HPt (histidine-containing phosphotransfer) domain-containing protein
MSAVQVRVLRGLLEDIGNDHDTLEALIQDFLTATPQLVAEAERAAAKGDVASCGRAVHTLKSTSATFGALDLSAAVRDLESQVRQGRIPSPRQWDQVEHLWADVEHELSEGMFGEASSAGA